MKKTVWATAALAVACGAAACGDAGGVDSDAINGPEKAAVQAALNSALANDSLYPLLALLVFPYIDRATYLSNLSNDTTRLVGIQLDIDVGVIVDSPTLDTVPLVAQLSGALGWNGYDSVAHTVDSVFFVIGAGLTPPVTDSLRQRFSPDTAGTGTGFVIHQTGASTFAAWLARSGELAITSATYGAERSQPFGTLALGVSRGTMVGEFDLTAKLVPDSATTVSTVKQFTTGVRALKMRITGTF
jgi:hypothetical protein